MIQISETNNGIIKMYVCTNKAIVDAIHLANKARTVEEIMTENYPDATFDGKRYHAPCDGYVCDVGEGEQVYRGGEYLPEPETEDRQYSRREVSAKFENEIIIWHGTKAQILKVREELKNQTLAIQAEVSQYISNVGDKVNLTLAIHHTMIIHDYYANNILHIMEDNKGNTVIYKGTKKLGERDDNITLTAKVKKHTEYKGVKQTIIERPKLAK